MPQYREMLVKAVRPRNLAHHKKWRALIHVVFRAQATPLYATDDDLIDVIKIAVGHCHMIPYRGEMIPKADSLSFAAIDQRGFEQFYDKAVHFILSEVMPRVDRRDLDREVNEVLMGRRAA